MRIAPLLILLVILRAKATEAEELQIRNLSAVQSGGRVSVTFDLGGAFGREEIVRGLESGLAILFSYEVELVRYHRNWFDRTLARADIEVVATFNSVTREYLFNYRRDGKLVRSETLHDVDELRERMTTIDEPRLLDPGNHPIRGLKVRVRADIGHDVVMFIIPRTVGTGWSACRIRGEDTQR